MNGFDLSNYEYFERGSVEDEKKDDGEEVDERTKRKHKTIDDVVVHHEQDVSKSDLFREQRISAESANYARDLANTRGT
jgi:leucyl aminopeptidase